MTSREQQVAHRLADLAADVARARCLADWRHVEAERAETEWLNLVHTLHLLRAVARAAGIPTTPNPPSMPEAVIGHAAA